MRKVPREEWISAFLAEEGIINMYYGRIRNGKTYAATADILDLLDKGQRVACNWPIIWEGLDERAYRSRAFISLFFGNKFYRFDKGNLIFISQADLTPEVIAKSTDIHWFIDEGQWLFDSYDRTDFSKEKRKLLQSTGHYRRSINIIAQRTQSVQVTARAQVNRFYKCEKVFQWGNWVRFLRSEYQDFTGEDVDESVKPISVKAYWGNKRVFGAYNSWYLRGDKPYIYPENDKYEATTLDKIKILTSSGYREHISASADVIPVVPKLSTPRQWFSGLRSVLPSKQNPNSTIKKEDKITTYEARKSTSGIRKASLQNRREDIMRDMRQEDNPQSDGRTRRKRTLKPKESELVTMVKVSHSRVQELNTDAFNDETPRTKTPGVQMELVRERGYPHIDTPIRTNNTVLELEEDELPF